MTQKVIVFALAIFGCISSCNTSKKTFGNGDKWLPADFNPSKTILLVEKFKAVAKVQQKMEECMSENYSYKYEFVDKETIENRTGKYKDTKLYKYALIQTLGRVVSYNDMGGGDFCFFDRENNKQYPATKRECSNTMMLFKPIINTIVSKY